MVARARFLQVLGSGTGWANYSLWAKISPLPDFVNKLLLEHTATSIHLLNVSGWLLVTTAEWSSCDRDCMVCKV